MRPTFDGVLFFPVTPFLEDGPEAGNVDFDALASHIAKGVDAGPGGVFVACGTGEFHAMEDGEFGAVVRTAVEVVAGRVPVYAGAGGSVAQAKRFAVAAKEAGADGLLLLPPYLVEVPQAGLVDYTRAVAEATDLPVIVYNRNNARFTEESAVAVAKIPNVIGFKDGTGNFDQVARIVLAVKKEVDPDFLFFNGLPTAETPSLPTGRSACRCTRRRRSPSHPTWRWRSTTRSNRATTHSSTPCRQRSSIRWCACATPCRATRCPS